MSRLSISRAMAVVALVAVNCAILRLFMTESDGLEIYQFWVIIGLLPLVNVQIVNMYLVATRYRISLRYRPRQDRIGLLPAFTAVSSLLVVAVIVACVVVPMALCLYVDYVLETVQRALLSLGARPADFASPLFCNTARPLLLGAVLSGPPLVLAFIFSWVTSRYRLVIVPRLREP